MPPGTKDDPPMEVGSLPVGTIFGSVVQDIQKVITEDAMAVDLELYFRSLTISKGGIPIFAPHKTEQAIEIRLATRVRKAQSTEE
jgi:hypothetical protein